MQKGNTLVIVVVVLALLLIGGGVAYVMTQSQSNTDQMSSEVMVEESMTEEEMTHETQGVSPTGQSVMEAGEEGEEVVVNLTAENFSFDTEEITVKQGDTVRVVLSVTGGMHDFVVDEFDARTQVVSAGQTGEVTFVADQKGEFEFYCSVGNHRAMGMVGTLVVE